MGELGRRLVHAGGVLIPAIYLTGVPTWREFQGLLVIGSGIAIALEVARLRGGLDEWVVYRTLTRPYEREAVAGYALYMFSITAVALVFPPLIALPAMFMLMLGDPVSGLLSTGELQRMKALRALLGMLIVSTAVALPFTRRLFASPGGALLAAVVGGLCATLADGVKPVVRGRVIDDNLTIPPAGALGIWAVATVANA